MFSRVSRLLLQASLQSLSWGKNAHISRMMFSTQKDINRLRETARIADQVIKMIQKPFQMSELEKEAWGHESPEQQIKRVNSYALAERIKNALMNLNNQQQSINDVLKLFTTGVEISDQIFHQQRIQNAKTGQKIVYYPNSIISSQIFSLMGPSSPQFNNYQKRLVLKGYKGISKTLSVSLLWQLSQLIDDYRFISQETEDQTKDKFTYPKIVYWSIRSQDTLEKVYESLLLQLPELKKQYTVNDLIRKKIDIGLFYLKKYGIKVHIVVDQINLLASWFRIIAPILSKKTKFQRLTPSQKKELQAIKYLMKLVKTISQKFSKTFYLSSMDIETQFLRKCDLATDENQTVVRIRQVKYAELIYNDSSLVELCHFFVAEFNEKKFKTSGIKASQEQLRETQEMCVQYLKKKLDHQNNPEYFFTTFLAISKQILESNTAQLNKNTDLKVFLFKRFTSLIEKSTEHTRQQFYEHFLKDNQLDPTRINTVLKISEEIKEIIEKEYSNQKGLSPQLTSQLYSIPLYKLDLDENKVHKVLPLNFFGYDNANQVTLRLPAKLTYQLLQPKIADWLDIYLKNINNWMTKKTTTVGLAGNIERLFVIALKKGLISFQMMIKKQNGQEIQIETLKFNNIKKGSYSFQPLSKGKGKKSLLKSLSNSLKTMLDKNQSCAVLEPVTKKFAQKDLFDVQQHQLHEASKGVDLILVKIQGDQSNQKRIFLNLIDVSVQTKKQMIERKIVGFLEVYLELLDKNKVFFEWNKNKNIQNVPIELRYFVFCQRNEDQNLLNSLRITKKLGGKIIFEGSANANSFSVSIDKQKNSLLTQVGFINIETDIKFGTNQEDQDVLSFAQALKVLKRRRSLKN